jgi:hypothetical protein
MTDLTRFTPGEVLAIDDKWGGRTFAKAVVFVGIDRGYAVVAEDTNSVNPFWLDADGTYPHLRRAKWKPRRVRASTVQGTWAEEVAKVAAERAEAARAKAEAEDYEARKRASLRALSEALESLPGVTSYTFGGSGEVRVYGEPVAIEAAAAAIAGLAVTA